MGSEVHAGCLAPVTLSWAISISVPLLCAISVGDHESDPSWSGDGLWQPMSPAAALVGAAADLLPSIQKASGGIQSGEIRGQNGYGLLHQSALAVHPTR